MSKVQVQVIGGHATYFTKEAVLDPEGKQAVHPRTGENLYTSIRVNASQGETIEVEAHEAARLKEVGVVRDPSDAPILSEIPKPTPFGVPLRNENDALVGWTGPVMGDPAPGGAGLSDLELRSAARGLSSEEAAEFQRQANEGAGGEKFNASDATAEEIQEYLDQNKTNVGDTVALAKGDGGELDPVLAERVLEAELARDNPRSGVVERLEAALEEDED